MTELGTLKQAKITYRFEIEDGKVFVNGIEAAYQKNSRGIPVVKFGETTIENIGVMKFRLEKNGILPQESEATKTRIAKTQKWDGLDHMLETRVAAYRQKGGIEDG